MLNFSENRKPSSFHLCNEDQGASSLINIDFYDSQGTPYSDAQFKDVCSCRNLPDSVTTAKSSEVDNHGNCIKIFCGSDCSGANKEIPPGFNYHSQILRIAGSFDTRGCTRPASFQPCEPSQCYKLQASVFKVEFRNSGKPGILERVALQTRRSYSNPTSQVKVEEYEVREGVDEFLEFTLAQDMLSVSSVNVEDSLEVEAEEGMPMVTDEKFVQKFQRGFQYKRKQVQGSSSVKIGKISQEKLIEKKEAVEVEACSEGVIGGEVVMAKEVAVEYTVWARVSGRNAGGGGMTALEIRGNLARGKMEYDRDLGEEQVVAKFEGVMKGRFVKHVEVVVEEVKGIEKCGEEEK